ncbi:MAG: phage holin family protein [Arcobacteraceae bacterium]|nr:phage holin family protein [Arcobacteraceae bacterium]
MNEDFIVYFWVLLLSIVGGTAHHIRKIKAGIIERFSFAEWFGDIFISAFVGYLTYCLCKYYEIPSELTAVFIGISSHLGTRAIILLEDIIYDKVKKNFKD